MLLMSPSRIQLLMIAGVGAVLASVVAFEWAARGMNPRALAMVADSRGSCLITSINFNGPSVGPYLSSGFLGSYTFQITITAYLMGSPVFAATIFAIVELLSTRVVGLPTSHRLSAS